MLCDSVDVLYQINTVFYVCENTSFSLLSLCLQMKECWQVLGRKQRRQLTLLFNTILRSEIHGLSCLIIGTLFLWMNFIVPLQLLGRMVSDCLIRCTASLGAGDSQVSCVIKLSLDFFQEKCAY